MKKLVKVLSLALVAVALFSLVACNSYPNVKKAFENEGYSESTALEGAMSSLKTSLEKEETSINIHYLYKIADLRGALIIEFKATQDMKDAIANNSELQTQLKGIVNDTDVQNLYQAAVDKGIVKGNCLLVPTALTSAGITAIIDIFKKA